MSTLNPEHLRQIRTLDDVLEYLTNDLDWPISAGDLEEATFEWNAEELGLSSEQVPSLASLRQLRPLAGNQPWGVFFLEFEGPRLPLTALRRLLNKLVTRKRASGSGTLRTWSLDDLLFIIATSSDESVELHLVAFYDQPGRQTEVRSIPWRPEQSPARHLTRLAAELLPHLAWPDDPAETERWREEWRSAFKLRHGETIQTVSKLVDRMATTARQIRDRISAALAAESGSGAFTTLLTDVRTQLVSSVTPAEFADMCAQTLVYGAMTSRVTDPVGFGASPTLSAIPLANPFLAAFFEEVHDNALQLGGDDDLEQLVADLRASEVEAILDQFGSTARGGDPVIHFYEEFLQQYDPEMKIQAGAFYTPQAAVRFMVRLCDEVLKGRLLLADGAADKTTWGAVAARLNLQLPGAIDPDSTFVSMLDPATGTGTFLVEWLRRAKESFLASHDEASWPHHALETVLPSVYGLELMLAPYAVAHLKTALELHDDGIDGTQLGIFLTDTLQRGNVGQLSIEPDAISVEGERADEVKRTVRTTICIGNPPYDRVARGAGGGWITDDSGGPSLFADILDPARQNTIFSHQASLYNKFVYFWRWALWKVFEDRPGLPGVVSLITPSSWLAGPGFLGLRQLVRELADEIWVVDLGGDNRGTRRDENIFEIETPVAIVTVGRFGSGNQTSPAVVRYRRIHGSALEKLTRLTVDGIELDGGAWETAPHGWHESFVPSSGGVEWTDYPALTDLFPWQQPGCMLNRTWPVSPDRDIPERRWNHLLATEDLDERAARFVTPTTGRNINTRVGDLPPLATLPGGTPSRGVAPYGFRSFDRQWVLDDPRVMALDRPALWASLSPAQLFMTSLLTAPLGRGPAATITTAVPDKHYFSGRGGKDVIPLYRDAAGTPNIAPGTLDVIRERLGGNADLQVTAERLFAYCYAVLAAGDYTERFREALETPGPRIPLTSDKDLFEAATHLGSHLLWLHSYGSRFSDGGNQQLRHDDIQLVSPIRTLPDRPRDIRYEADTEELIIGDGRVGGVTPDVWTFEVSGMPVVKKWLGYRSARAAGRAATSTSPLDQIRPTSWSDAWTEELLDLLSVLQHTVDLRPRGSELLARICSGSLITAGELPVVPAELREPPSVRRAAAQDDLELNS